MSVLDGVGFLYTCEGCHSLTPHAPDFDGRVVCGECNRSDYHWFGRYVTAELERRRLAARVVELEMRLA
jgi:hypothetical protein